MNGEEAFKRGLEFYRQEEYLKVVECFEKALGDENFVARGKAWFLRGAVYDSLVSSKKLLNVLKKRLETKTVIKT